jgi:hypothetical protein
LCGGIFSGMAQAFDSVRPQNDDPCPRIALPLCLGADSDRTFTPTPIERLSHA